MAGEPDVRACLSSYFVFGSVFLLLTLFGLYVEVRAPSHDGKVAYIFAGLLVFFQYWLGAIRLASLPTNASNTLKKVRSHPGNQPPLNDVIARLREGVVASAKYGQREASAAKMRL